MGTGGRCETATLSHPHHHQLLADKSTLQVSYYLYTCFLTTFLSLTEKILYFNPPLGDTNVYTSPENLHRYFPNTLLEDFIPRGSCGMFTPWPFSTSRFDVYNYIKTLFPPSWIILQHQYKLFCPSSSLIYKVFLYKKKISLQKP